MSDLYLLLDAMDRLVNFKPGLSDETQSKRDKEVGSELWSVLLANSNSSIPRASEKR